ncbi:MAG: YbgC/FadM family acyl-CoA thioesterase [Candidatus Omnitrophota bacterium]
MKEHRLDKKVYYHDTDSGGVVYYANYLRHLEEGRTEFLRSLGIDTSEYAGKGVLFPVVRVEIDYKAPARYGDAIGIYTSVEKIGNASVRFKQQVRKGDTLLVSGSVVWACVDENMKAKPVPEEIRKKLSEWAGI